MDHPREKERKVIVELVMPMDLDILGPVCEAILDRFTEDGWEDISCRGTNPKVYDIRNIPKPKEHETAKFIEISGIPPKEEDYDEEEL